MRLYCLEDFKDAVEKLSKNKSHATLQQSIIDYFCDKQIEDVRSGINLNNSEVAPYIKKRLDGSGGYRIYYLVVIKNDCLYLMYVHPKTGAGGSPNITEEAQKAFYKKLIACIKDDKDLYEVTADTKRKSLVFTKKAVAVTLK